MSWRTRPNVPPYWIEFANLILEAHPAWEPFVRGPLEGHGLYGPDDERFFVEIPSEHPTIREPLTIEIADRVPCGMIDTYWNGYFEHNPSGRSTVEEHVAKVLRRVEEWMSDSFVFELHLDPATGRRTVTHRLAPSGVLVPVENVRVVRWSWLGTHDTER